MLRISAIVFLIVALAGPAVAATIDGIDIHYSSAGTGRTMVFVHGWTCDTSVWAGQLADFAQDHRVIALDLPGHGRSGAPADGIYTMDLFARAVEAVRAEAGASAILLVGHSMGVRVIRHYALAYPDRVVALLAADGSIPPLPPRDDDSNGNPPAAVQSREQMIRQMFAPETPVGLQDQLLELMLGTPQARATAIAASMAASSGSLSGTLTMPVLAIVAGTRQVDDADSYRATLPRLEIVQMPGTGHFLMMEKPTEFNRITRDFLRRIGF
jgi:pimeloyl-ACP methyl ester carboxylesterase